MNTRNDKSRQGAMALVIVLGALVLITLLCLAFFTSTSRELNASKSYASGVLARFYADTAVHIALGQLSAATTVDDATKTWTSQPGLLRQFDDQGRQIKVFKLYSSDRMIEEGDFALLASGQPADVPAWVPDSAEEALPWNRDPGVYTDMNAPLTLDGKPSYPILNPGGLQEATRIQGFDVAAGFGLTDNRDLDQDGDTTEIAQIPMPVRWIYILKDGSFATASRAGDKAINLSLPDGGAVPNSNPPVARVAFWTDDDTCRLNVNTASEGDYWTIPVAVATDDTLSSGQVNAREFQRYPGHPATTSLSPALDFLTANPTDLRNFIFALAPRISGRGSQFGTRRIGYGKPVELDDDRLYASVDDLLFLPGLDPATQERYRMSTANIQALKPDELDFAFSSTVGYSNMAGSAYQFSTSFSLDPARLELLRFFLTVDSNAPEVNLFGKPRISLWPVDTRSTHQGPQDKLLAFSATVNGEPYYFQRQNPESRTEDYDSIPRNIRLMDYLDQLTSTAIPGLGGNFSSKYDTGDRKQTLTSIFDWIRTVNLAYRDPAGGVLPYAWQENPAANGTTSPPGLPGSGQVLPIKIGTTSGFGRFPTLSKGALAIVREEEPSPLPSTGKITVKFRVIFLLETYVPMLGYAGYIPDYQISVSNLANAFEAVADVATDASGMKVVAGSEQVVPLTFQDGSIRVNVPANVEPFYGRAWGGTQGFNNLLLFSDPSSGYALSPRILGSTDPVRGYPFVSAEFGVQVDVDKKDYIRVGLRPPGGAALHSVDVQFRTPDASETIGSYTLPFPSFPPVIGALYGDPAAALGDEHLHPKLQERVNQMADAFKIITGSNEKGWANYKSVLGLIDVGRGLELEHGDLRLLALHGSDTVNAFVPHRSYTSALAHAHSLLCPGGSARIFYDKTKLIPYRGFLVKESIAGFSNGTSAQYLPQAPSRWTGSAVPTLHDFTTGIGSEGDGPHIIKADEGNSSSLGLNWGMSELIPYQNQLFPWDSRLSEAFSPNRQVASAVQLGTLPSRASSNVKWETLLFRPDFGSSHPGASSPPDSALLDLFWMPIVDPYPISRPLSTAGKVNMNTQIAPFTYIVRSTALLGALKSVKITAIPKEDSQYYKHSSYTAGKTSVPISYLYDVDALKTMLFFDERFANPDPNANVFKSPSEICSIPLAPRQNTSSRIGTGHSDGAPPQPIDTVKIGSASDAASLRTAMIDFWSKNTLTGDNALEAPYNHLYPRLTTQSNVYTVYVRAQSLQVPRGVSLVNLPESRIRINGEYRGSFKVERYIDPEETAIPDFTEPASFSKMLYPLYKFRIKSSRQFLPQ